VHRVVQANLTNKVPEYYFERYFLRYFCHQYFLRPNLCGARRHKNSVYILRRRACHWPQATTVWVKVINLNLYELEIIVGWVPCYMAGEAGEAAGARGLCLSVSQRAVSPAVNAVSVSRAKLMSSAAVNNEHRRTLRLFVRQSVVTSDLVTPLGLVLRSSGLVNSYLPEIN